MSMFNKKEGLRKTVSVITLYAVFIQQIVPLGWAHASSAKGNYYYDSYRSDKEESINEEELIELNSLGSVQQEIVAPPAVEKLSAVTMVSSGGGQAETSGFSIGSTDGMVNKFTGDFNFSIPLMDVEGYPIVIAYNSNIGMNSEASWVGLGWDLSVGAVSREMRGIPDDFNGQQVIEKEFNQLDGTTEGQKQGAFIAAGVAIGPTDDPFLTPSTQLTALWGQYYSPMVGHGKTFDLGLQATFALGNEQDGWSVSPSFGLGYSRDSKNGIGTSSNIGLSLGYGEKESGQGSLGATFSKSFNSRVGLTSKSVGSNLSFGFIDDLGDDDNETSNSAFGGVSLSGSLQYGTRSMVPSVMYRNVTSGVQESTNAFIKVKFGPAWSSVGTIFQTHTITNNLQLFNSKIYQPAIGYFHSGKRKFYKSDKASARYPIMDFNRGTRNEYSENMTYLDYSAQMYDLFRVNTGGYSATFRGRRTDIGTYYDAEVISETDIENKQYRAGMQGPTVKFVVGYAEGENTGEVASGNHEATGSGQNNILQFETQATVHPTNGIQGIDDFDEAVYFKSVTEMTPEDQDALNYLGGENPARFVLLANDPNQSIDATNKLVTNSANLGNKSGATANGMTNEIVRSAYVKPITVVDYAPSSPTYLSYHENNFDYGNNTKTIDRSTSNREDNHLTAVETVDNNGTRYVFGIPAYNLSSVQCMFSVDPATNTVTTSDGLVEYTSTDASVNNTKGRSNLFDRTTVPDYAHSFLLTEMLSSNYSDVAGDGPTTDDVGTWYKFNYTQAYGLDTSTGAYKWSFPMTGPSGANKAFYDEAAIGSKLDDKANYSYGEKEIWYVHTVESKNMIAEFHVENRQDAYGVSGQTGHLNTSQPLKALRKIVLYNRSERINNAQAEPIQTVEFDYDYSLCKRTPGNVNTYGGVDSLSGKLTLKSIRVYSGTSEEMALSSYEFTYSDVNPNFNYADIDGWGNYKVNSSTRPNAHYPYAAQDQLSADQAAQAWRLTEILNPAGGKTTIQYEADSYAHVQDKEVMQHFDIHEMTSVIHLLDIIDGGNGEYTGASPSLDYYREITPAEMTLLGGPAFSLAVSTGARPHKVYTDEYGKYDLGRVPNNVIIFPLEDEYSNSLTWDQASDKVEREYFKGNTTTVQSPLGNFATRKPIYFKIHTEIDKTGAVKDYVPFFATIANDEGDFFNNTPTFSDEMRAIGVMPNVTGQSYKYGYVVLEPSYVGKNMKKSSIPAKDRIMAHPLHKAVLEYARMNLPDVLYGACNGCTGDVSIDQAVVRGKKDVNRVMTEQGFAKKLIADMSAIRLTSPDSTKYGGNGRVKQISYSDSWNSISDEYESTYTWNYEYGDRISTTGVASYEPGGIRDENAMYYWSTYQNVKEKFPDESKFIPLPVADLVYPNPVIGYETVQVEFNATREKGYSETNFYTSKDFPTVFKATGLDKTARVSGNIPIIGITENLHGLSQGYVVITNDYHGKMKSAVTYDGLGNKQAQSIYEYYGLGEAVKTIDRNGNLSEEKIAMEYDIHADANYASRLNKTYTVGADLKFSIIPPTIGFSPIISIGRSYEGFWSNTFIKHINKSAVVRNIQSWNMQSVNNARNLAFDRETGNVIVSSLQDEYNDTLYSFAYPAHWYYDQCRSLSEVDGFSTTGNITSNSLTTTATIGDYFVDGDHLQISNGVTTSEAYILFSDGSTATLINNNGTTYSGISGSGLTITILESGRDNMLGATMQSAVTKKKPDLSVGAFNFPEDEVISMSAMSLKDRDNLKCRIGEGASSGLEFILGSILNPYPSGIKGKLIGEAQFAYQSGRINDTHAHGIRFDGTIDTLVPFYKLNSGEWYRIDETGHPDHIVADPYQKWRNLGSTTMFDQFGKPLESKDQIDIRSAVLYGYNDELEIVPVAQAVNARKQNIAFDGFEDYSYYDDVNLGYLANHFNFKSTLSGSIAIDSNERHSGLRSLRISSNKYAQMTKLTGKVWDTPTSGFTQSNFVADTCLCIPTFEPTPGDYIIGAWIKVGDNPGDATTYTTAEVETRVTINGGGILVNSFSPTGPIIDGWQRVEGQFEVPQNALSVQVRLENNDSTSNAYFDDLRIHPFLAGMTTTVYDPKTLLPLATHDGYNFTTFYNYDENLNQVRVRVETIEGIKTVSEVESGGQKRFE